MDQPSTAATPPTERALDFLLHSYSLAHFLQLHDLARLSLCDRTYTRPFLGQAMQLDVSSTVHSPYSVEGLQRAARKHQFFHVGSFTLKDTKLSDRGLLCLVSNVLTFMPSLQHMDLSGNSRITSSGLPHLVRASTGGLPHLPFYPHRYVLPHLVSLSLANMGLDNRGMEVLVRDVLPQLPSLEDLDISRNTGMNHVGLNHLAKARPNTLPKLRTLRLAHNEQVGRPGPGVEVLLCVLRRLAPHLEGLDMTRTGLNVATLAVLIESYEQHYQNQGVGSVAMRLGSLKQLWIGQNILQERGAKLLTTALLLDGPGPTIIANRLEVLTLNDCYMGDEGVRYFIEHTLASGRFPFLRELRLKNNGCGAAAVDLLGQACVNHLPRLEILSLRMNMMLNEGALAFAASIKGGCMPALREVSLAHNMIEKEGAWGLLEVLLTPGCCPLLRRVDMSHNGLRVKAAEELSRWVDGKKVDVVLQPPALYCQLLLKEEEEEEEDDAKVSPSLIDWTVEGVLEIVYFASALVK